MKMVNFGNDVTADNIRQFVKGGRAVFTLESQKTGAHYTYQIKAKENDNKTKIYFISFMTDGTTYNYMGVFNPDNMSIRLTAKSKISADALVYKAINYFLSALAQNRIADQLIIYHANKCACCGRELTEPESVRIGIGPICREAR